MHPASRGFTLLEVMVTSAIVGILAAIALPNFQGPVYKARRIDGITSLMQLQLNQERWRSTHPQYAQLHEMNASSLSSMRHYTLSIEQVDAAGFSAIATATGAQAGDAACRVLRLTIAGGDTRYSSGPDESTANTSADNRRCWGT